MTGGLQGSRDHNSQIAPILPGLRSIDALNTHDDAFDLAIAGGITTVQVLPGSSNNIGKLPHSYLTSSCSLTPSLQVASPSS
jgi:hypothetical protein